jgi:hypothetical protein
LCGAWGIHHQKSEAKRGHYGKWLDAMGGDRPISFRSGFDKPSTLCWRSALLILIAFLAEMQAVGYDIKRGKAPLV